MRGWIIPIGGRLRSAEILRRFVELSGGALARIAIIATASHERETGGRYERLFAGYGVKRAKTLGFDRRSDCDDADWLAWLANSTGVFLSGGNQLRLATTLGGTPAGALLRELNRDGVHVAGTSAGAAYLSEHMIAFGEEGSTPRAGMVAICPGLGLTNRVIIDQHFRQRDRLGRLLTAVSYNPFCLGIGVDEDTAAFIDPEDAFTVLGSGAVTVIDPALVQHSSVADAAPGEPITLTGATLHVLGAGSTFDILTRRAELSVLRDSYATFDQPS